MMLILSTPWNYSIFKRLRDKFRGPQMGEYIRFEGLKPSELKEMMDEGLVKDDKHNDAPALSELANLPDEVASLDGYVIFQPRGDYRLSVDAVAVKDLNAVEDLDRWFETASSIDSETEDGEKVYYFWWD